jgi:L-ascorbate metabolism protein UlaG (beta-lactamase superfamily)
MPDGVAITWYGHASFGLEGPDGTKVLIDPWLDGPTFPADRKSDLQADVIVLTHGHVDHASNTVDLAKRLGVPVLAPVELAGALGAAGVENATGFNKGGTVTSNGISFTMTTAEHTGSIDLGTGQGGGYAEPAGYVIAFGNGTKVYAAGDTAVFSDMALIGELYRPQIAILPIGDHYTMGPFQAAHACRLLQIPTIVAGHWGTFPLLTGTPAALREELAKLGLGDRVTVLDVEPGGTLS